MVGVASEVGGRASAEGSGVAAARGWVSRRNRRGVWQCSVAWRRYGFGVEAIGVWPQSSTVWGARDTGMARQR